VRKKKGRSSKKDAVLKSRTKEGCVCVVVEVEAVMRWYGGGGQSRQKMAAG
jgi:hypothetical protein